MKKAFFLGLAILLLAGFFSVACNSNDDPSASRTGIESDWVTLDSLYCCPMVEITDENAYWDNIAKSQPAWEEARTHFTIVNNKYTDDYGVVWVDEKYTDDYGGVYVDENGIFHISVVGNRKPVKSDYLIYKQVSNSYNFLESILVEISEQMEEFTVWKAGIYECCNSVLIFLENEEKIHLLIDHLKTNNLFRRNTLKIYVGENIFTDLDN
jgi:hypothetical protein